MQSGLQAAEQVSFCSFSRKHNVRPAGNVRQLRNVVERLVVTHVGDLIHYDELPPELTSQDQATQGKARSLNEAVEECEKATILAALATCEYHREKTAKCLGISLRTLHYKMVRYGLNS